MENWLQKRVYLTPEKTGLYYQGKKFTFKQIQQETLKRAAKLKSLPSEFKRVAVIGRNTADFYFYVLALQQLQIEIVFLNNRLISSELDYQIKDSRPDGILFASEFSEKLNGCSTPKFSFADINRLDPKKAEPKIKSNWDLNSVSTIIYTSGTTGKPKGVLQTLGNHWTSAIGAELNLPTRSSDIWVCATPIFHISGFSIMMRSLIYGVCVNLYSHFNPERIDEDLKTGLGTIVSVVPNMLERLLDEKNKIPYSQQFSYFLLGGAPISETVLQRCKNEHIPVMQSYGMTETASQSVALNFSDAEKEVGSVGKPLFPVSLKINQPDKNRNGEILLKGGNVTPGYLHSSLPKTPDGFFKTGDIGHLDRNGFLFITGRLSEMIISGGENIYPQEIESVISQNLQVKECAVVSAKDKRWGEIPVAYIVLNHPVQDEQKFINELTDFLTLKLARFKIPKQIKFLDALPRTGSGKIDKQKLKTPR